VPAEPARTRDVIPGVFSRHAGAYRDRVMTAVDRGEARGRTRVVELLGPRPGERVLDMGCGPGVLTLPLARAVGATGLVLGVDLAEGMLALLRQAVPANCGVARMDMDALAVPDGAFDAVAAGHSLQFSPDLGHTLSEARRALRPGGRFAASVPGGGGSPGSAATLRVLDEVFGSRLPDAPQPADSAAARRLVGSPERLAAAVEAAGFRDVAAEVVQEVTTYRGPEELVSLSMGWWACAWRLESVPDDVRDEVRAEAIQTLRRRFGDGQLTIGGTNVVVSAVR
jgi:O-methyltransferase/aklanonic acid methyltransferase